MLLPAQTAKTSTILRLFDEHLNKWLNASKCEWCRISLSFSLSLSLSMFVLSHNAYLSPSSFSHMLHNSVRVLVVLHNLSICDKCLCLGCNNLVFFPQGSNIMILFQFHDISNNSYATYQLTFYFVQSACLVPSKVDFVKDSHSKRWRMGAYKNSFLPVLHYFDYPHKLLRVSETTIDT